MPDQKLQGIVERMVQAGESEDNIALVIQHYKAQPTAPPPSTTDTLLADNPALPPQLRAVAGVLRFARAHPTGTGAAIGGAAAAPFTGGLSALPAVAAMGAATAAGAGTGSLVNQAATGQADPHLGQTMLKEGIAGAAGEGGGRLLQWGANKVIPAALKMIVRPGKGVQQEFPDVIQTIRAEQIPVGASDVAHGRMLDSAEQAKTLLAAIDAERPIVRGYLPPAREAMPLGTPPTPGSMPMAVETAQRLPLRRPPLSPTSGHRFAEHIPGVDPVEDLSSSYLTQSGHPMPDLPSPGLSGPGVMYRDAAQVAGPGAHGNMVDPRELVAELRTLRGNLANRPMGHDAVSELDGMIGRLLDQRQTPLTLSQTNAIKQQAQELATTAYRAADKGFPVNSIDAGFNKGVAKGARLAVERRVPAVGPINARTQDLIGLEQALSDAELRHGGAFGLNPLHWAGSLLPGVTSSGAFATDTAIKGVQSPLAQMVRQALLGLLAGGGGDQ